MRRFAVGLDVERMALVALLALPAASGLRSRLQDNDLWWHLATGRWIVEHGTVPTQDPFSYTAAGHPWIAYSWLPELLFHYLTTRFGFAALRWMGALVLVAMVGATYRACRSAGARPIVAVVGAALGALAGSGGWAVRPQTFAFLFLALTSWALHAPPGSYLRRSIPLIVIVWANTHISFVFGPALVAWAASVNGLRGNRDFELEWLTLLSAAATLANPYGWSLLAHVPTIAAQPAVVAAVTEFHSPDLGSLPGMFFAMMVLAVVVLLGAAPRRPSAFELGTLVGSLALALWMQRNMAIFGILCAPTLARALESVWPASSEMPRIPSPFVLAVHWAMVLAGAAALLATAPRDPDWRRNIEPGAFPVAAADVIAKLHSKQRLFNDFDWGGFLIFRLYDRTLVSIDGRTAAYEPEQLEQYSRTHFGVVGWQRFFDDCRPEIVLWPRDGTLASLLRERPGWQVAYEDGVAVIFERTAS